MRIRIDHSTRYAYARPARFIVQMLRLTPRSCEAQQVREWRIETDVDARLRRSDDAFGNIVHSLYTERPTDALTIRVTGEVSTVDTGGVIRGQNERLQPGVYLRDTRLTQADAALIDFARSVPEGAALVVSGLVIVAVLAASSWLFGATVVGQLNGLAARLPSDEAQLRTLLERLPFGAALSDFSFNAGTLAGGVQGVAGRVGGYALNAFSALTNTALVLVAGVYLALKPAAAREGLLLLVPESRTSTMRAVLMAESPIPQT